MFLQEFNPGYLNPSLNLKIKCQLILVLLIFFQVNVNNFAQKNSTENNDWLVTTIKHLEKNISTASEKITHYQNEILKCDKTIATSEKLINLARDKGNSEAEKVAKDALVKSKSAKDKNMKLLDSAKNLKRQSEQILASIKKELSISSGSKKIEALTLSYSGKITIKKNNGDQNTISDSRGSLLESGDVLSTSTDSEIELQFLKGRGNLFLGENSNLKFSKNDSVDVVDFIGGKVKIAVEKIESFEKRTREEYEKLKQDIGSLPESYEQFFNRMRAKMKKKFEIRTGSGGGAIRGTEFIVNHNDKTGTELIVLEGSVEMFSKDRAKTIILESGQKGIINSKGQLSDPLNIDLKSIDKWWNDDE